MGCTCRDEASELVDVIIDESKWGHVESEPLYLTNGGASGTWFR